MKYFIFSLFLNLNLCFSQEKFINTYEGIYFSEGLIYKQYDQNLFTGTIEFIKKNGTIRTKEIYKNGYLTYEYLYFNKSARGNVYEEKIYYEEKAGLINQDFKVNKVVNYHTTGEVYSIKYYDKLGNKVLEEKFKKGELIYTCEFKNGKRHGKEFCTSRECGNQTFIYSNGKKQL